MALRKTPKCQHKAATVAFGEHGCGGRFIYRARTAQGERQSDLKSKGSVERVSGDKAGCIKPSMSVPAGLHQA